MATRKEYTSFFAINYKVPFVPVPLHSPMGKVDAGMLTLGRYQPVSAERYNFSSAYSWPKRLFMLDRSFILTRYTVSNGKQLVLINTHNSAFNDATDMRTKELNMLKEIIEKEYNQGNYMIVRGDWNQILYLSTWIVFRMEIKYTPFRRPFRLIFCLPVSTGLLILNSLPTAMWIFHIPKAKHRLLLLISLSCRLI